MIDSTTIKNRRKTAFRVESAGSPEAVAATAGELGFDGIELAIGPLRDPEQVASVFASIRTDHPPIIAVSATCETADLKTQAPAVVAVLAASAKLGATCLNLTLPSIQSTDNPDRPDHPNGFPSYQSAVNFLHQLFNVTRLEAERYGVALAIEVASGGCFLSPVEMRDLVDTANTWAVGVCLDANRVAAIAQPADWIRTLTHRLHSVRVTCDAAGNDPLLEQTAAALDDTDFKRTICVICVDGPAAAIKSLRKARLLREE